MTAVDDAVTTLRARWAESMPDTCTIKRITGRGAFNPTTGTYDSPIESIIYSGAFRIRSAKSGEIPELFGQEQITELPYIAHLPYTADGIEPDDVLTVDTCAGDPGLVGATMRVMGVNAGSRNTHRHVWLRRNLGSGSP